MASSPGARLRGEYDRQMAEIRRGFELNGDGVRAAQARCRYVDDLVQRLWATETGAAPLLVKGVTLCAVGGYGRGWLFPCSDIDLLVCVEKKVAVAAKEAVRRISQSLWDCGVQVALQTRQPGECERFDTSNAEFGLALLDLRFITGDTELFTRLREKHVARMQQKDAKAMMAEVAALTRSRHAKYGGTLFHLEPNIKDCPGGLRDAHVSQWLRRLNSDATEMPREFGEALSFLAAVRCFLHYRNGRDDNTLDWLAQDAAAAAAVGYPQEKSARARDAAYWMRAYFRHARVLERQVSREAETANVRVEPAPPLRRWKAPADAGFRVEGGRVLLDVPDGRDAAAEPETVLAAFAAMARTGAKLAPASEMRIAAAIPRLSEALEEGPGLWRRLRDILLGRYAGAALRAMHALGLLELLLPEFHGIDALVIRDAYHRYTVDEHTFVLLDTLHGLEDEPEAGAQEWRKKFGAMIRELQNPGLLYLAALLHDTGKGRTGGGHAAESTKLAQGVLARLEMDAYETGLVLRLIETHLEMSAALRRDIFDAEAVRTFAAKVQTHESLRMLTLFTYGDIAAVHPDALTPWKAENLWRLSMVTANHLDRHVDEERVQAVGTSDDRSQSGEKLSRVLAVAGKDTVAMETFLEGFPARYLNTRSVETILAHFRMTRDFGDEPFQLALDAGSASGTFVREITLVTLDRSRLFAGMAAALAAWGMNVVTADAFANANGVVVDSFRFTDTFRTLEMNPGESERFVSSVRDLLCGRTSAEAMLNSRRRGRRKAPKVNVETRVEFDVRASSHSTLLQVIAQDVPGLLRAVSMTLNAQGCNVEVALVDTEGEMAIDVFYVTKAGEPLSETEQGTLREALTAAIVANAV